MWQMLTPFPFDASPLTLSGPLLICSDYDSTNPEPRMKSVKNNSAHGGDIKFVMPASHKPVSNLPFHDWIVTMTNWSATCRPLLTFFCHHRTSWKPIGKVIGIRKIATAAKKYPAAEHKQEPGRNQLHPLSEWCVTERFSVRLPESWQRRAAALISVRLGPFRKVGSGEHHPTIWSGGRTLERLNWRAISPLKTF